MRKDVPQLPPAVWGFPGVVISQDPGRSIIPFICKPGLLLEPT